MITKAKQNPAPSAIQEGLSLGSAIKQNIVEKLPVINTQVRFKQSINYDNKFFSFCRQLLLSI